MKYHQICLHEWISYIQIEPLLTTWWGQKSHITNLTKAEKYWNTPPIMMFHLFQTLIEPIITYGSYVWGRNKISSTILDIIFLRFLRYILGIKCKTSNNIVLGGCGRMLILTSKNFDKNVKIKWDQNLSININDIISYLILRIYRYIKSKLRNCTIYTPSQR